MTWAKSHKSSWLFSSSSLLKTGKPLLNHCEEGRGTESVSFGIILVTAVFSNVADVNCQYYHHLWSHLDYLEKKRNEFSEFEKKSSPSPKIIHFLSVSGSATNSIKMYGEKKLSAYK